MKENGDSLSEIFDAFKEYLDDLTNGGEDLAKVKEYYEMLYEEVIDRTHVPEIQLTPIEKLKAALEFI